VITHTVLFRFADPADAAEAEYRLTQLRGRVAGLDTLHTGLDLGATASNYHLALRTTHADEEALAAYVADAVHQEVVTWITPRLAARAAVDAFG